MIYIETVAAAEIFSIHLDTLKKSATRNSQKYPFVRIKDAGTRSRGGAKLLFEVEIADIDAAIKGGKADKDVSVYVEDSSEQSGFRQMKFSEIKGGKDDASDGKEGGAEESEEDLYITCSEEERNEARAKVKLIKEYEAAIKSGVSCKKFCEDSGISSASFFRWQSAYRSKGLRGLIDKRGKKRGVYKLEEWMKEFILTNFRKYGAGDFNITQLWKDMHAYYGQKSGEFSREEFLGGKVKPFFDTGVVRRFIKEYYKNRPLEYAMITKGEDKTNSAYEPASGKQAAYVTRRNQLWQIDSSKLDVIVRDGEGGVQIRPAILSIIDVYSGRCVATLAETSNSLALTRLLWRAIETLGKPECIKGDNGMDYLSDAFTNLIEGLNIDYDHARAYKGKDKAFVERHFGTIQRSMMAHTPGYIGGSLAARERIEQRTPKKDRKDKDEFGHKVKTNQKYLLTYEDMKKRFETAVLEWDITDIKRKKTAPIKLWNADTTPLKGVRYEEFILFAGFKGVYPVTKKGVTVDGITYSSRDMLEVKSKVRVCVNIDDVTEAFIFTEGGKFVCKARDIKKLNFSAEEFSAIGKTHSSRMKAIRKAMKATEVSEFTRTNVNYDLQVAKAYHQDSLKKENRIYEENPNLIGVAQIIKEQDAINSIKSKAFDYESLPEISTEPKNKKKFSVDDAIEIASGE